MKATKNISRKRILMNGLAAGSFVLAACFAPLPAAAQYPKNQPDQNDATVEQQQMQPDPGPGPQNGPPPSSDQYVPATLTLQAGTVIPVRITEWLSSDKNVIGDRFSGSLEQPLIANGWVVAQRGQIVTGRVAAAQKAGRVSGVSQLGVELNELTLVDGQLLPVRTQLLETSAGTSKGRDAAGIGTTTGVGAAIGAAAGGGEGAGIGAGIGAAAGIIGVLTTRGRPTVIAPETLLTFRLEIPTTISTERSQLAFQPVRPADYRGDQDAYASHPRQRYVAGPGYAPAPLYYSPYPWYGYGYYPGLTFGYYGYYGPRYYGGFRGGFGGRGGFRR
jgi:hypothetical protein